MSISLNRATLVGHLGADPEIRRTQAGKPVASFSLATSETWRDRNSGERKENTEWHRVVVFNEHSAEFAEKYLKKGSYVMVEGQIKTRKWQGQDGQDRYSTEIVVQNFSGSLGSLEKAPSNRPPPPDDDASGYGRSRDRGAAAPRSSQSPPSFSRDMDDDIPF